MLNEELVRFWGSGSLVSWPAGLVAKAQLPDDARTFLSEVGFPRCGEHTIRFNLSLDEMQRSVDNPRFMVIAYDYNNPIYVDTHRHGCVVCLEACGKERFINSDVRRFGKCLMLYERYRRAVPQLDDDSANRLICETELAMKASDSAAFGDTEHWWPVVVEQMKAGFL